MDKDSKTEITPTLGQALFGYARLASNGLLVDKFKDYIFFHNEARYYRDRAKESLEKAIENVSTEDGVRILLEFGQKVDAVIFYRNRMNCSMTEAASYVENSKKEA